MNNRTERTDYNSPLLPLAAANSLTNLDPEWNVYDFGLNKTVRIVLNTDYVAAHPMHIHGHSFQVLSAGPGPWDGTTVVNAENPLRRDVHTQPRYGHAVIQFTADNPGAWTYHCHIAWHASMGLNIAFLEQTEDIAGAMGSAGNGVVEESCKAWDAWTNGHVVDQIDAGI
jgi:hypothetical protein